MVDETLKRLLEAEAKAEQIVARAETERRSIIEQAHREVHVAEQQHAKRATEIRTTFLDQAEQRAQQSIVELQQRYAEYSLALRASAEQREQQALDEAVSLLTGSGKDISKNSLLRDEARDTAIRPQSGF